MEKQRLYFIFNKPTHTINRTVIFNMPNSVAKILETKFKIEERKFCKIMQFKEEDSYKNSTDDRRPRRS